MLFGFEGYSIVIRLLFDQPCHSERREESHINTVNQLANTQFINEIFRFRFRCATASSFSRVKGGSK